MNRIILMVLFFGVNLALGQTLIGEFSDATDGNFISENRIILHCNECPDLPKNTVAFYSYDGEDWTLYDSLTTRQYYPDRNISRLALSKDESTLSLMMYDPENPFVNADKDLLLVFKKINGSWTVVHTITDITHYIVSLGAKFHAVLSGDGNTLVTSDTNVPTGVGAIASEIITKVYNYKNDEYVLSQVLKKEIYCADYYHLKYLTEKDEIIISPHNESSERDNIFIKYSLADSIWIEEEEFIDRTWEQLYFNELESDITGDNFLFAKSSSGFEAVHKMKLEYISVLENDEIERTVIFTQDIPELRIMSFSASDNLSIASIDINNGFLRDTDTLSYIDYLILEDNEITDSHRFSFPIEEDPGNKFGKVRYSEVSPSGRYILFNRAADTYVFDMVDFLSSTAEIEYNFSSLLNLTESNLTFDKPVTVKVFDLAGRLISEYAGSTINMYHYPSGMYIIHYITEDKVIKVERVVKM